MIKKNLGLLKKHNEMEHLSGEKGIEAEHKASSFRYEKIKVRDFKKTQELHQVKIFKLIPYQNMLHWTSLGLYMLLELSYYNLKKNLFLVQY